MKYPLPIESQPPDVTYLHEIRERSRWEKPGDVCPWCGGQGVVFSILERREIICRLCLGAKTWDGIVPGVTGEPCKHGDPTCPCQDGDACHYEAHPDAPTESGKEPLRCPTSGLIGCTECGPGPGLTGEVTPDWNRWQGAGPE